MFDCDQTARCMQVRCKDGGDYLLHYWAANPPNVVCTYRFWWCAALWGHQFYDEYEGDNCQAPGPIAITFRSLAPTLCWPERCLILHMVAVRCQRRQLVAIRIRSAADICSVEKMLHNDFLPNGSNFKLYRKQFANCAEDEMYYFFQRNIVIKLAEFNYFENVLFFDWNQQ